MTLVYGLCRGGEGVLVADTATSIPLLGQSQHPFREPTLKILAIGDAVVGYAGNTAYLPGLLSRRSDDFQTIVSAALECHEISGRSIDFIVARQDGQEMITIREGRRINCERCYIGSPTAFNALRQQLPQATPASIEDEVASARMAFSRILQDPSDGVAGFMVSCTLGGHQLGYASSLSNIIGDFDYLPVKDDGWRTVPLVDRHGGQFTVIFTGLGYDGICIGLPQPGVGYLFIGSEPEPILKLSRPTVSYRDLSGYDLAKLADALDAQAIQVGIPDSIDVAWEIAVVLREELEKRR
ncbi:hypothetical protein ACN2C7_00405 [Caulobacter sp. ErkDOM-E]|uniref:hypothetical protein n=1 Tax=Caulobacter sp. ErkDOM-E TaxID=3402778 RepID=UPI003AF56AAB